MNRLRSLRARGLRHPGSETEHDADRERPDHVDEGNESGPEVVPQGEGEPGARGGADRAADRDEDDIAPHAHRATLRRARSALMPPRPPEAPLSVQNTP